MKVKLRLSISSHFSPTQIVSSELFNLPPPSPVEFRGPHESRPRARVRPPAPPGCWKNPRAYYSNSPVKRNEYLMLPDLHISWGGGPHRSRDADRSAANRLIINRRVSDRPSLAPARAAISRTGGFRRFSRESATTGPLPRGLAPVIISSARQRGEARSGGSWALQRRRRVASRDKIARFPPPPPPLLRGRAPAWRRERS